MPKEIKHVVKNGYLKHYVDDEEIPFASITKETIIYDECGNKHPYIGILKHKCIDSINSLYEVDEYVLVNDNEYKIGTTMIKCLSAKKD